MRREDRETVMERTMRQIQKMRETESGGTENRNSSSMVEKRRIKIQTKTKKGTHGDDDSSEILFGLCRICVVENLLSKLKWHGRSKIVFGRNQILYLSFMFPFLLSPLHSFV